MSAVLHCVRYLHDRVLTHQTVDINMKLQRLSKMETILTLTREGINQVDWRHHGGFRCHQRVLFVTDRSTDRGKPLREFELPASCIGVTSGWITMRIRTDPVTNSKVSRVKLEAPVQFLVNSTGSPQQCRMNQHYFKSHIQKLYQGEQKVYQN